jgi:hypothetical protein
MLREGEGHGPEHRAVPVRERRARHHHRGVQRHVSQVRLPSPASPLSTLKFSPLAG